MLWPCLNHVRNTQYIGLILSAIERHQLQYFVTKDRELTDVWVLCSVSNDTDQWLRHCEHGQASGNDGVGCSLIDQEGKIKSTKPRLISGAPTDSTAITVAAVLRPATAINGFNTNAKVLLNADRVIFAAELTESAISKQRGKNQSCRYN